MSKLENNITNHLKMLSLDMIKEAGSGDVGLSLCSAPIFTTLFLRYLNYNRQNSNYINRDRVIVSNKLLPLMYASLHLFADSISMDNLKEYKKLNSITPGFANMNTPGIEIGSNTIGDVIASSVGIALGERYLENLIKLENNKCDLINYKTICICSEEDLMSGLSYEAMSYAGNECLNKLIFIVVKTNVAKDSSTKETFKENLTDRFIALNYNVDIINNNASSIDGAIDDAYVSKKPTVIVVKSTYGIDSSKENSNIDYNSPLSDSEMTSLRNKYKLELPYQVSKELYLDIRKEIDKRLEKKLNRWQELKEESLKDLKLKEIINFLENGLKEINFKPENIKINTEYNEELLISNNKILNILANKSPFVLCGSNDNFVNTLGNITKSNIMQKDNPTARNIIFGSRTQAMGGIANGLAALGFKVFISAPLKDSNVLMPAIRLSAQNNLDVNYIFSQDTFLNTYENMGDGATYEINNLRNIPGLINFRPADINEIIGVYDIKSTFKNPSTIIIGSDKVKKLLGTNYKYVMAGAYRVKKERENVNAIIIATGSEVPYALNIANELEGYGIDFRVVSMPSMELFRRQTEKYQNMLLPKDVKTFTLEFSNKGNWYEYAK